MSLHQYEEYIANNLSHLYEPKEAALMGKYLIADLFGNREVDLEVLNIALARLQNCEPLQYVTERAYFLDYVFYVNNQVLIPRPETEELVMNAVRYINENNVQSMLEMGTGSGCISIAIKKRCPDVHITAIDISDEALTVAMFNANHYGAAIDFKSMDFLDEKSWTDLPNIDLIVSNPPYISHSENLAMHKNVLAHEPVIALFAGDDPLLFYKAISKFGVERKAAVFCEINEYFPEETKSVFENAGYSNVALTKDLQGKNRILSAFGS